MAPPALVLFTFRDADHSRHSARNSSPTIHLTTLHSTTPTRLLNSRKASLRLELKPNHLSPIQQQPPCLYDLHHTMQPLSSRKRKSDQLTTSSDEHYAVDMTSQRIPTKGGSPHPDESPFKRQRVGITLAQKQALIDNLQLESTSPAHEERRTQH